ncbi:MAG: hypothetical protein E7468_01280 [Ruminococcaceae bacterium]|nr:hypothetical protein [Oscillospiraceae bacterium]
MAGITEAEVYEAFGLGAQAQELADPANEGAQPTGAQVQELADPAGADDPSEDNPQSADNNQPEENPAQSEAQEPGTDGQELTPEQRRQNAEQRRRRERQAQQAATDQAVQEALRQERSKHEADMQDFFARAGLVNTVTNEPITNMEQFNAWQKQSRDAQLQKELQAGKLTPEGLQHAIGDHPVVQQVQQRLQADAAQAEAQARAQARAQIEAEIAEIGKLDASVKSIDDLVKAPYWNEMRDMVDRGYSLKDAHFLLNHKRLEDAKVAAAQAAGANNARGKDHMTGLAPVRGGGNITVPADQLALYRQFMPNATDAEIQAHYNQYKKT